MIELNPLFLAQLKRHEGYRLAAYLDSVGVLTIGYGHNVAAHPVPGVAKVGDVISAEYADKLLIRDVQDIAWELDYHFPWWRDSLSEVRQAVLLNMAFNLGMPKLKGFAKMLRALQLGDWNLAGREMLSSKWAVQVKSRSAELATQMITGAWQEA